MPFPLPDEHDTVILIAPPMTVVGHTGFLYGHKLLAKNFLQLRLEKWLRTRCSKVTFVDNFFDRESAPQPKGTLTAGPRSTRPKDLPYMVWGLSDTALKSRLLASGKPDQVWITTSFPFDETSIKHTVHLVRDTYGNVPIILGGVYASLCFEKADELGIDYVQRGLLGETEHILSVKDGLNGFILGGRGCPNHCSYCAMGYLENVRPHLNSLGHVLESVDTMIESGMSLLTYYAPNILACGSPEETDLLLQELGDREIALLSCAGLEASHITPKRAALMRRARLLDPLVPLQTLERNIAAKWGRRENITIYEDAIAMLEDAGFSRLEIGTDIIIGHPDQTLEEAIRSMCFVWSKGISPLVFPYTIVPRSADAKKLNDNLRNRSPESYHPLLWLLSDPSVPVEHFIELGMLSKVLPECIEMALNYLNPDTPVPGLIRRYLEEFGFDIPQWTLNGELPALAPGYQRFLSHPWELVLRLLKDGRQNDALPFVDTLGSVEICETDYLHVPRLFMEQGHEKAAFATLEKSICCLPPRPRKKAKDALKRHGIGPENAFAEAGEIIIHTLNENGLKSHANAWIGTIQGKGQND